MYITKNKCYIHVKNVFLTHNREYWNAISSVVVVVVANNFLIFYQFGLLDFNQNGGN